MFVREIENALAKLNKGIDPCYSHLLADFGAAAGSRLVLSFAKGTGLQESSLDEAIFTEQ